MELQELYGLMDRFAASGLTSLEWEHEGERVALRREPVLSAAAVPASLPAVQAEEEPAETVAAPLVGVFYAAPAPEEPEEEAPSARPAPRAPLEPALPAPYWDFRAPRRARVPVPRRRVGERT